MVIKMKKIILFSPNGYVGGFIKRKFQEEQKVWIYEITRDSDWENYEEEYDIMIYSAAITSARHEAADKYVQDNVVAAVSIMGFCKEHHVKRVIYLSSDEIYGEINTDVVTEKAIMVNPNLYAVTKYLAEQIIIDSGIPYYILRLPGIVGRIWGRNFIYNLMDKIQNNEPIELYNMDRKFNNIVDIDDLTAFISRLCDVEEYSKSEIFLLGSLDSVALKDIVSYIKILCNSTSVIHNVNSDKKRYFTLDVTKAKEYGYSAKKIKTIIKELHQMQEE